MARIEDTVGAFVRGTDVHVDGAAGGPLSDLTFVAKDLFDVAGHPTGGGNPDWARQNPVPTRNAWAVQTLLDAGATLVGKTITDEVSLGILGENAFDGVPRNPAAPDRVPGGSSSGTAAAVGAGLADFGLGTDTGGSVRVPASFSGLFGIRPTHGRLDLTGMMPQAPTSDTTGWLTRDGATFRRVSEVMLGETSSIRPLPDRLVIATDAFGFADPAVRDALRAMVGQLRGMMASTREDILAPPDLSVWGRAQRTIQPVEAWETFRPWIERDNPRFAFTVARGLVLGAMTPAADIAWAELMRREARGRLAHLVPPGTVLAMPTTPFPAPPVGRPVSELTTLREQILCLCAHGGLAGHPQVNVPGAAVDGLPVGLSLVGARGEDIALVALADALSDAMKDDTA